MRIASIGGGPAGLYAAILLKKADAAREVTVWERNPADVTWGWGVVFSEQTLGNFRVADPESYAEIERAFVRWGDIAIEDRGARFRSTGHDFCGLARKKLLQILQSRAAELGVVIHFGTEAPPAAELAKSHDLVLAADGVNSVVRNGKPEAFGPSLDPRRCRYIWLGASRRLAEFTFLFRENGHGVFQVHAYPFDAETSTFIVETSEETFVRAGLDQADEAQSIAYCEALFEKELAGAKLLGNRSVWNQFRTLRSERWADGNVVLIGDAAHTAHFSIGSGTKLAMEDSIALARAVSGHGDVAQALAAYEAERRPEVTRLQRAAQESLEWFEHVERYEHTLDPIQLAFSLLTRSRRISHESLRVRDASLVDEVDRFLARRAGVAVAEDAKPPPPIFLPFDLGSLRLPNRVVVSPMCMYSADDGVPGDFHFVHYGARAMGGAGLLMTEMTDVAPDARISPGCTGLWNGEQEAAWKRIVQFRHRYGAMGIQLAHAGRKGSTRRMWDGMDEPLVDGNWDLIAPSPLAYKAGSQVPRAMKRADMDRVRDELVASTKRAARAGFDFLELHFAHGYLFATFLSPLTNVRDDEYGGSLENRMRWPLEVFDAVRAAWPREKPLGVRLSAHDWAPGGITAEDVVATAAALGEHGCDVIDVLSAQTVVEAKPAYGRMWQAFLSDLVRNEARIATMSVGGITTADEACSVIAAGRADLVVVGRAHLDDPHWTLHAAKELGRDVAWPVQYGPAKVMPLRRR